MNTKLNGSGRRSFLKRMMACTAATAAGLAVTQKSVAALGPSNVLTAMSLSATSARRSGTIVITAKLNRLDGQTAGTAGVPVKFFVSEGTYATYNFGVRYTDGNGQIVMSLSARNFPRAGKYFVIAEVNPGPSPENWIARPLPYAAFNITN